MGISRNSKETLFTLAYIVMGAAGAVAAGFLTYGSKFAHFPRPMLPFLIVGLVGALIYSAVQMRGFGTVLLVFVLFFGGQLALSGTLRGEAFYNKLFGAGIYVLPIGSALIFSAYLFRSLAKIPLGKFVLSAAIIGAGFGLMVVLWLFRQRVAIQMSLFWAQAFIGAKLGAGVGLGFELVDLIGGKRPRPAGMPEN
jgi:hypothetical protein